MGSYRDAKCHWKEKLEVTGPNQDPRTKPSKGAAVFPEVKGMIKMLKRTPVNRSISDQSCFRSGRLNKPGLSQHRLQWDVRSHTLAYYRQNQHLSNYLEK